MSDTSSAIPCSLAGQLRASARGNACQSDTKYQKAQCVAGLSDLVDCFHLTDCHLVTVLNLTLLSLQNCFNWEPRKCNVVFTGTNGLDLTKAHRQLASVTGECASAAWTSGATSESTRLRRTPWWPEPVSCNDETDQLQAAGTLNDRSEQAS